MKPLKLFITAFGPYAGTEVVDFRRAVDAGLFGIYGPTGSGKSSIFSAMAFALFGEGAKHEQPTASMRSGHAMAQVLTEVSLLFELGGKRYFVRRQPEQMRPKERGEGETPHKHTAFLFDVSGVEVDDVTIVNCGTVLAEKKVGLVDKRVTELLGYDIDQFRQIVLLPQGQFERFLAADSKARLEILRGLFDVSLYQRMTDRLHERASEARAAYQQGMLLQTQQLQNAGFDSTDDLSAAITAAGERCVELDGAAASMESARASAATALSQGEALQKKFDDAATAATTLSTLRESQADVDVLRERHTAAGKAAQLVDRDDAITRISTSLSTGRDAETLAVQRVDETIKAETSAQERLVGLKAKSGEIDALKQRIADLERYGRLLADAADLKAAAEATELSQKGARTATSTAKSNAESAVLTLDDHRKALELAQGNENERFRLTAMRQRLEVSLRLARGMEQAQSLLADAEKTLTNTELKVERARTHRGGLETSARQKQTEFIVGQARLLADGLQHGDPCPVCGSADHPKPAHGGEPAAGLEAAWRDAQALFDDAAKDAQSAESAWSSAVGIREERKKALDGLEAPEARASDLDSELTQIDQNIERLGEIADLVALADRTRTLEGAVKTAEAERSARTDEERLADTAAALARQSYNDHIATVPDDLQDPKAIAARHQKVAQQVLEREQEIELAQAGCTKAKADRAGAESGRTGAAKRIAELEEELVGARAAYSSRRDELGLTDATYQAARLDIASMPNMLERLDTFRESLNRAQGRADDTALAIQDQERPDLDDLRLTSDSAQLAAQSATQAAADARAHSNQLSQLLTNLRDQMDQLARLNEETGPLRALADAFEGRNAMSTTLETYAVGAMFDQVLEAANLRFGPMSQGRYRLERDVLNVGGRRKRGLDIRVHDIQTGRAREVSTLSGGETFIAALSLALGLSDIVEMSHGSIRLDTIFIDEGFGSLDSDGDGGTLDQVLQVLQDIVGQRRAVGLISHVPLVQQAVPNGFTVIKSPSGSRIEERIV